MVWITILIFIQFFNLRNQSIDPILIIILFSCTRIIRIIHSLLCFLFANVSYNISFRSVRSGFLSLFRVELLGSWLRIFNYFTIHRFFRWTGTSRGAFGCSNMSSSRSSRSSLSSLGIRCLDMFSNLIISLIVNSGSQTTGLSVLLIHIDIDIIHNINIINIIGCGSLDILGLSVFSGGSWRVCNIGWGSSNIFLSSSYINILDINLCRSLWCSLLVLDINVVLNLFIGHFGNSGIYFSATSFSNSSIGSGHHFILLIDIFLTCVNNSSGFSFNINFSIDNDIIYDLRSGNFSCGTNISLSICGSVSACSRTINIVDNGDCGGSCDCGCCFSNYGDRISSGNDGCSICFL